MVGQDPPAEDITPAIYQCVARPQVPVISYNGVEPVIREVEVIRQDNAMQAYQIIDGIAPKELSHGGPLWGHLYVGVKLDRVLPDLVFREPHPDQAQRVVIKKLLIQVVQSDLDKGGAENPYKEIFRMQTVGDNEHVLGCVEALKDDNYLYIITPYCEKGSLVDFVPLKPDEQNGSIEEQARRIYRMMLGDLGYLHEEKNICHRDIDPGNFLVTGQSQILLNDLAMSIVMPPSDAVNHLGRVGKPAYWPPEIFHKHPFFYARKCDLWAATVSLFNLLTGEHLYRFPHPPDVMFRYLIMARGLSPDFNNELVTEVVNEASPEELINVTRVAQKIMVFSPQLLELFEKTLCLRPEDRWTREQVLNCAWMRMG